MITMMDRGGDFGCEVKDCRNVSETVCDECGLCICRLHTQIVHGIPYCPDCAEAERRET